MFSGIREGSIIYIMDKTGQRTKLLLGEVKKVSNQYNKLGQYQPAQPFNPTDVFVDITTSIGESTLELKELPAQAVITEKVGYVVSESREAMYAEMDTLCRKSKEHLQAVPWHENMLEDCDEMEPILNPAAAREREQSDKIKRLEERMSGMDGTLNDIHAMLSSMIEKPVGGSSKK